MSKRQNLLFAMLVALTNSVAMFAHDFEANNADGVTIYYTITSSEELTCAVSFRGDGFAAYSSEYSGDINIPSTVKSNGKTYSVTSIKQYAFGECPRLTSVTIPNSVVSIGDYAFWYCSRLTSIALPGSITSIGTSVFKECSSLVSVEIPNSITSIEESAFEGCSSLTSLKLPDSLTSIGNNAFSYCTKLDSVVLPNSVTSIGKSAFCGCI